MSKSPAVIYHFWSNVSPDKNLRCPILSSIASLRYHHKDNEIPVYVLDVSKDHNWDWSEWEKKLSFKVVKWVPYFRKLSLLNVDDYSVTEPSRHLDVYNFARTINQDLIFYVDSDVFFLRKILPLWKENCTSIVTPIFTAFFYFRKSQQGTKNFVQRYHDLALRCLADKNFCEAMYEYIPYRIQGRRLWSEVITYYLYKKERQLLEWLDPKEFSNIEQAYQQNLLRSTKAVHLFYQGEHHDEMNFVSSFKELREPSELFLGNNYVEDVKPGVKPISLYNEDFSEYMRDLTKNIGVSAMKDFLEQTKIWLSKQS